MASLSNDGGRSWRILLGSDAGRKVIRFRGGKRDAERFRDKVGRLAETQGDVPEELLAWFKELPDELHKRLARVGLTKPRENVNSVALTAFMDQFFAQLTGKPATRISYGNVRRNLEAHFGASKPIREITTADADAWRAWMVEHEEKDKDGKTKIKRLATPTISRRVIAARTMWGKAVRWKLAAENPFAGVKSGQQVNEARKYFVSREIIDNVIAEAPDTEWAVIIALARYAGIRIPSELFALRWADVDFDAGRMTIRSAKTEHHDGGASRVCPLFAELRPHLETLFKESGAEGNLYVIAKHRLGGMNLRTELQRIIRQAGLAAWPKLFHNLRASRESELMREYDLATVCKWIGNSPAVAAKHYATSVDLNADFQRASGKAAQNPAQHGVKLSATEGKAESADSENPTEITADCTALHSTTSVLMGREGLEPATSAL